MHVPPKLLSFYVDCKLEVTALLFEIHAADNLSHDFMMIVNIHWATVPYRPSSDRHVTFNH